MTIQGNEFSKNQELLFHLAKVLIPLSEKVAFKVPSLSQHLFIPPPPTEGGAIRHSVRSLKSSNQADEEIKDWIDAIKKIAQESSSDAPKSGKADAPTPPQTERAKEPPAQPLAKNGNQSKVLVDQVRIAMQVLSSIPATENNKGFRDFIKKLKPMLDSIIEAVGKGESTSENGSSSFAKTPFPATPLKAPAVHKKEIPLPFPREKETAKERKEAFKASVSSTSSLSTQKKVAQSESDSPHLNPEAKKSSFRSNKKEEAAPLAEDRHPSPPEVMRRKREASQPESPSSKPEPKENPPLDLLKRRGAAAESEPDSRPNLLRTDRPPSSLPYTPQQLAPPSPKPKKKRKTFWFRDEEEEEEREEKR